MGWEWSREAETGSKWSDGFSGGFGMGFDQQFVEKTMKSMIFHDFLSVWDLAPGSFWLILHQWGADVMKLDILAAFNTNSRCLIRIWRSWGLIPSRNRKQGAARVGAGVGKICKNMKIGKSWKMGWEWSGEVQTGAKWSAQLSERF